MFAPAQGERHTSCTGGLNLSNKTLTLTNLTLHRGQRGGMGDPRGAGGGSRGAARRAAHPHARGSFVWTYSTRSGPRLPPIAAACAAEEGTEERASEGRERSSGAPAGRSALRAWLDPSPRTFFPGSVPSSHFLSQCMWLLRTFP